MRSDFSMKQLIKSILTIPADLKVPARRADAFRRLICLLCVAVIIAGGIYTISWTLNRRRIEQELRRRGIDPSTAATAAEGVDCEDFQQALALLEKKYYNMLNTPEDRRRTTAALARRGFTYTAIRRAMDVLGAATEEEDQWQ